MYIESARLFMNGIWFDKMREIMRNEIKEKGLSEMT